MAEALNVDIKNTSWGKLYVVSGAITEDSKLDDMNLNDPVDVCVFDMAKIQRINSYGIRQWINLMKRVSEKANKILFTRCPPNIIEQFNMIGNFGGGGQVLSFYLPFYREDTNEDKLVLVDMIGKPYEDYDAIIEAAKTTIDSPDKYEFNDIEEEYFSFLKHQNSDYLKEINLERILGELP